MDDTIASRRSQRSGRKANAMPYLLAAGVALLILVIVAAVAISTAQVKLVLNGGGELTMEYGEVYAEPGATAKFLFFKADVQTQGQVPSNQLGSYTVPHLSLARLQL